jgi:hypothetical protein
VRSTGDTTFLLEQHTPEPTPIEEKKAPTMSESNPIEAANAQITAPTSDPADQHSSTAANHTESTPTTASNHYRLRDSRLDAHQDDDQRLPQRQRQPEACRHC